MKIDSGLKLNFKISKRSQRIEMNDHQSEMWCICSCFRGCAANIMEKHEHFSVLSRFTMPYGGFFRVVGCCCYNHYYDIIIVLARMCNILVVSHQMFRVCSSLLSVLSILFLGFHLTCCCCCYSVSSATQSLALSPISPAHCCAPSLSHFVIVSFVILLLFYGVYLHRFLPSIHASLLMPFIASGARMVEKLF